MTHGQKRGSRRNLRTMIRAIKSAGLGRNQALKKKLVWSLSISYHVVVGNISLMAKHAL